MQKNEWYQSILGYFKEIRFPDDKELVASNNNDAIQTRQI